MTAPATQAQRNRHYSALAVGARRAETFITVPASAPKSPDPVRSPTRALSPGKTERGDHSVHRYEYDNFAPCDTEDWGRPPPNPDQSAQTSQPEAKSVKPGTITQARRSQVRAHPYSPETAPYTRGENKDPRPTSPSQHLPDKTLKLIARRSSSSPDKVKKPSPPHQTVIVGLTSPTYNQRSSQVSDWVTSVHQAVLQHPHGYEKAPTRAPTPEHTDNDNETNTIERGVSGEEEEEDDKPSKMVIPSVHPSRANIVAFDRGINELRRERGLDPQPHSYDQPLRSVDDCLLLYPYRDKPRYETTPRRPQSPLATPYSRQGYESLNRIAAMEQDYEQKLEAVRRREEELAAALNEQQEQQAVIATLQSQNRELLAFAREGKHPNLPPPVRSPPPSATPAAHRMEDSANRYRADESTLAALRHDVAYLKLQLADEQRLFAEEKEARKRAEELTESAKKSQSSTAKQVAERDAKIKELEGKVVREGQAREMAERRQKDAENARNNPEMVRQLNLKNVQLDQANQARENWEVKCRTAQNEYSKIADKLKMIRLENAALQAQVEEEGKGKEKDEAYAQEKKALKSALMAERATSSRIRSERSTLRDTVHRLQRELTTAKAQLEQHQNSVKRDAEKIDTDIAHPRRLEPAIPLWFHSTSPDAAAQRVTTAFGKKVKDEETDEAEEIIEDEGASHLAEVKGDEGWSDATDGEGKVGRADVAGVTRKDIVSKLNSPKTTPKPKTVSPTPVIRPTLSLLSQHRLDPSSPSSSRSYKPMVPTMNSMLEPARRQLSSGDLLGEERENCRVIPNLVGLKEQKTLESLSIAKAARTQVQSQAKSTTIDMDPVDPFADLGDAFALSPSSRRRSTGREDKDGPTETSHTGDSAQAQAQAQTDTLSPLVLL